MSFWDSSAVIPLVVTEPASGPMRKLLQEDGVPTVWWGSLVECWSALERRASERRLDARGQRLAGRLLHTMSEAWHEVQPGAVLRDRALRLLSSHDLRAADSLQLAAALVWAQERPKGRVFVSLDSRLSEAALREGFTVLPERGLQ